MTTPPSPEEIEKVAREGYDAVCAARSKSEPANPRDVGCEFGLLYDEAKQFYREIALHHLTQTASLRQEIEGLRKDKERLDWLQANVNNIDTMTVSNREQEIEYCVFWMTHRNNFYGKTLREALDAAVQQAKEAK